ncbi:MAG: hypothetical protein HWE09_06265 [Cyclobacteriaceae bacterium]|uniref:hypothetical protein n=1 Tax=Algoriphagus sp. TaxID=1872435 RepID=UPI0017947D8E|nr:hypothetical protein [Algoriphagus sp.]NVJ87249.1 hypothetical protein [Algoriphagus sp.]NVK49353.1 hypothetical protein [Cyclobacteriaceae bacterium]
MKNSTLHMLLIVLTFQVLFGCRNETKIESLTKTSDSELTDLITKQVDSLYSVYKKFDYDWIEFYDDTYTAMYPDSPIQLMTKDSLLEQWKRIYAQYNVKLLSRGQPTIIPSADMAISYNSFNEIFINKETLDTIKNSGIYLVNWKRQSDDSWKIVFEAVHQN